MFKYISNNRPSRRVSGDDGETEDDQDHKSSLLTGFHCFPYSFYAYSGNEIRSTYTGPSSVFNTRLFSLHITLKL